ncbi:DUF1289 domain-containing protein [Paraburkholderia sp. EG286B]|uniref:DUF1289 domain-containing protein n=1 Tax=Paraburkholderia sp. EG286B TaxID=3237011 RepID=UPI0034D28866
MIRSDHIINPCINICRMDPDGQFCQGCWRTLREIGLWDQMNEQQKADVVALIECRRNTRMSRMTLTGDSAIKNGLSK